MANSLARGCARTSLPLGSAAITSQRQRHREIQIRCLDDRGRPADVLIEDVETDNSLVDQEPEMDFARFPLKERLERGCFEDFAGTGLHLKDYAEDLIRKFMQNLLPKRMDPAFLRAPLHQRKRKFGVRPRSGKRSWPRT